MLDVLLPFPYLDPASSPLGRALRSHPLLRVRVNDQELDTLSSQVADTHAGKQVQCMHPKGLTLTCDVEPAPEHHALTWRLGLAQDGDSGPRVHDLQPLVFSLDGALAPDPVIHTWLGGAQQTFFPPDAVTPQNRVLYPRTYAYYQEGVFTIGTQGGRSSDHYMPYVVVSSSDDTGGLWLAIGWSGNWSARFLKPHDSVDLHIAVNVEPCNLHLPQGMRLQGPAMAMGLYHGDYEAGCNMLRRWLRSRMPAAPDDLSHFNTWAAMDADVDEERLLRAADRVAGSGLRYFMLDAGWYPSPPRDFNRGVGNWRVDERAFPRGLEPVAERVRAHGMEMGLWVEPERAHVDSELAQAHPGWLLAVPGREYALVNFALPEVRAYFWEVIGDLVRRLGLRWLKWDFNLDPLPHWQAAADGGVAHLGHVDGVWETFDRLRSTFPSLVLENCASGGNRLDWTLFSRAAVNFANDQYTQPDCIRRILGRMAAFLPSERVNMIFGPYQRRQYSEADWQIMQGSAFGVSEPIMNWTEGFGQGVIRHHALHRTLQSARSGDFYRLTPDTPELRAWECWQMHDPETSSGVLVLWRSSAADSQAVVCPRALDPTQTYRVTDLYAADGQGHVLNGAELARGLHVALSATGAALYAYRPVNKMPLDVSSRASHDEGGDN